MKTFLIAEIGINHNGDIELAKQLIDMSIECGWDAVKFQKRNIEKSIPKHQRNKIRNTPWGEITYYNYKKKMEFGKLEFNVIDSYCYKRIPWFASAWDTDSLEFLEGYNLRYNKVASPMITNTKLLQDIAEKKRLTFISTGMSKMEDIDTAVDIFKENNCQFVLMHCVGIYPCPVNKLNLNMIVSLKERYPNDKIGYSSHYQGAIDTLVAKTLGAEVIEKHITLDRAMWGTDHAASLEKKGMKYIRENVDDIDVMLGTGEKELLEEEIKKAKELRYW